MDAEGKPDAVLQAFALHLYEHLLIPSGQGCGRAGKWVASVPAGCFTYEPPPGVVWKCGMRNAECGVHGAKSEVRGSEFNVQGSKFSLSPFATRQPAAVGYLSRCLCAGFALALLATGCAGPRPLRGGKAVTTRQPAGMIEQTLVQSENPSQASKQTQESVKVRTYTLPVQAERSSAQRSTKIRWSDGRPRPSQRKSSPEGASELSPAHSELGKVEEMNKVPEGRRRTFITSVTFM